MKFGSFLKGFRNRHNISQDELAKHADTRQDTVYRIETGKNVSIECYDKIARAYGLRLSELIARWEKVEDNIQRRKNLGFRKKGTVRTAARSMKGILKIADELEKEEKEGSTISNYDPDSFKEDKSDKEYWDETNAES